MSAKHGDVSPTMARLSAYIADALTTALPDEVVEKTKAHLLDTIASMVSGALLAPGKLAIGYVRSQVGAREAQIITTNTLTTATHAAFANAMLAHADETDDSHMTSRAHMGCSVIPAALAVAERDNVAGALLLRAIALGYDVGSRVLFTLSPLAFHQAGHCTHSFAGIFGATAATTALARLSPQQAAWTLSYAAQQAAGITSWRRGADHVEKAFVFAGLPARNAVEATAMVSAGFSGVNDVFFGRPNFFDVFGQKPTPELLVNELGERHEILNTTIKKWTVGSPAQSVLDGVQALLKKHTFDCRDIREITIRMTPLEIDTVDNRDIADISLQYLVALLLIDKELTFASSHDDRRMADPAVLALKQMVKLTADPERERRRAHVLISLRSGQALSHQSGPVRGSPANPMTHDEVTSKALDLMSPLLGVGTAGRLIHAIWNNDELDTVRDLRKLCPLPPRSAHRKHVIR